MQQKREADQQVMKEALQAQIEEKNRKKDLETKRREQHEIHDEQRVKDEMKHMAVAEGMDQYGTQDPRNPQNMDNLNTKYNGGQTVYNQNMQSSQIEQMANSMNPRKTAYAAN